MGIRIGISVLLAMLATATAMADGTARRSPAAAAPTGRFLVQLAPEAGSQRRTAEGITRNTIQNTIQNTIPNTVQSSGESADRTGSRVRARADALLQRHGLTARGTRALGERLVNVVAPADLSAADEATWLARLAADPEVSFAEVDQRRYAHAVPADALYDDQWYLQSVEPGASRFDTAWDRTTGAGDTVVAVLDTGIRFDHPDLSPRLVPGYDFVSAENATSALVANDGDGWDADATDPGDWVSGADLSSQVFSGCRLESSSWHGTRVAGMIGATANNSTGIAGGTWAGSILPIRVLGKCGGFDSDIIAGMRWAAGLSVPGVPNNPNPAQVLNMSLGAVGTCARAYRDTMADLTAAGVLVIASAGNENGPVDAPANCPGILAVGGLRHIGTKVGYSSQGLEVGISAAAGNCVNEFGACLFSLLTTSNSGATEPETSVYTDAFNINIGTSFAAPIVAAIAGLMHGVNDNLQAGEYTARIKAGSRPFPLAAGLPVCPATDPVTGQCNCTASTCGAGIADADGAVTEALRPIARIARPANTAPGVTVSLNGAGSAAARGRTISSYAWTVESGGNDIVISTPSQAVATVLAPSDGTATIRLTVTDSAGRSDSSTLAVGGRPGGGGGSADGLLAATLLGLATLIGSRRRRTSGCQ
jgi:serine protease